MLRACSILLFFVDRELEATLTRSTLERAPTKPRDCSKIMELERLYKSPMVVAYADCSETCPIQLIEGGQHSHKLYSEL
jgi:hypothetical protein